jgi:hypothetical protein
VHLETFHGALSEETTTELEAVIEARRDEHAAARDERTTRITRSLENG